MYLVNIKITTNYALIGCFSFLPFYTFGKEYLLKLKQYLRRQTQTQF